MIDRPALIALVEKVATAVRIHVAAALVDISKRIDDLEARILQIPAGPPGLQGPVGERGMPGAIGPQGEKGDTGESVIGPKGDPGEKGVPGESITGPAGQKGDRGEKGLDGKDGRDGRDGRNGENGRDAAEIDPLMMLDPQKSYPRGTWVCHEFGLLRSTRQTDPTSNLDLETAGWKIVIAGAAQSEIVQDEREPRRFHHKLRYMGKETIVNSFFIPAMIYQQIWKEGDAYVQGDCVTYSGNLWHCNAASTTARPGPPNNDWRLAVRSGRDGRDGKEGAKGDPGPEGRAGRDLTQVDFYGNKH